MYFGEKYFTSFYHYYIYFQTISLMFGCSTGPGGLDRSRTCCYHDIPVYMNAKFLEVAGASSLENEYDTIGDDFWGWIYPDDVDLVKACNKRICANIGSSETYECRIYTLQRTLRLIRVNATSMKDGNGKVLIVDFVMNLGLQAVLTTENELDHQTGLITMHSFFSVMESWKAKGAGEGRTVSDDPLAVLFINLTNFRMVNLKAGISAGDALIATVGKGLREFFTDGVVSHFDGDHFAVLTRASHAKEKAEGVRSMVRMLGQKPVDCFIGICIWDDQMLPAETVCNRAKVASDANRRKVGTYISFYTKEMGEQLEIADYVVSNIDEAVSRGWIQVYCQPVIRSISGKLCGMEALARWIDPIRGFLAPDKFIGPLEESQKIAKLDLCVIEQVCSVIAHREQQSLPEIPISVNLSRIDFITCDIYEEIETLVRRYDVPRRMLHLEVTESTLTSREEAVFQALDRFRAAGYEIWMDDFGSGYSTLNLLKDYSFDVLKIDMVFLRKDTPRSRAIIASVIAMDKKIGNRSLAEGVETKEQAEFLKRCGCEKLQGYYFGKPQPFEETLKNCEEKGITVECAGKKACFDALESVDFMTDVPLTLAEVQNGRIQVLFANDPAMELIRHGYPTLDALNEDLNNGHNPADRELLKAAGYAIQTGRSGEVFTPFNGRERRLRYRLLSGYGDYHLFAVTIHERLRSGDALPEKEQVLLSLRFVYRHLFTIDPARRTIRNVQFTDPSDGEDGAVPLIDENGEVSKVLPAIFPADRGRYEKFLDLSTLCERVQATRDGVLRDAFRTKRADGTYAWMAHRILYVPNSGSGLLLYGTREIDFYAVRMESDYIRQDPYIDLMMPDAPGDGRKSLLWDNLLLSSPVPLFFLNKDRKLTAASHSFLSYFGISKVEEFEEKTRKDLAWSPSLTLAGNEDQKILESGEALSHSSADCISNGVTHQCLITLWPIYQAGKVAGIMGYFLDETMTGEGPKALAERIGKDPDSGLDSLAQFLENLGMFVADRTTHGKPFGIILIDVPEIPRIEERYGRDALLAVVRACADVIKEYMESRGPAARLGFSRFGVVLSYEEEKELDELAGKIREDIDAIHRVGTVTCTLFAKTNVLYVDEAVHSIDALEQAVTGMGKKA